MRPASSPALAAGALATALLAAAPAAFAQDAPSTGYDLSELAKSLIDATSAGIAFAPVPDTRFRLVRHTESNFTCAFLPSTEAVVAVVAREGADPSTVGDDSICMEHIDDADMVYRITRVPNSTIDEVFADARLNAGAWLQGEPTEAAAAPNLLTIPTHPNVTLDMERRQILLLGRTDAGPALLRIAVARRPGGWYLTQQYFASLSRVPEDQLEQWALNGSVVAEYLFATRLAEMISPTLDPSLLLAPVE